MPAADDGLRRVLGTFDATNVVVGAIVGVGIFFTPSRVAALAGGPDAMLLVWVLGGLIAIAGALTFAELGGMYPRTGGQYTILRDAYGPAVGFVYVICSTTAIQTGSIAVIALISVRYAAVAFLGTELDGVVVTAAACALVVVIALANAIGVRWGAAIQNLTVLAKVLTLLAIASVAALFAGEPATPPAPSEGPTIGLVLAALVPALFTFGGWQQVLWVGGEVREPARTIPRATVVGVAIVVAIYLLANWSYLQLLGHAGVAASKAPASDAVAVALGDGARRVVAAAVAISALGVLNAQLLTAPRLVLALAQDGRFFAPFAGVHARFGTPVPAIVMMAAVSIGLLVAAGADGVDRLLTGVVMVDAVFFALTGLATLVLARDGARATRPVRMPGFPWVPLGFVIAEIGVIVGVWVDPDVRGAAWIGVGWIVAAAALFVARFRGAPPVA